MPVLKSDLPQGTLDMLVLKVLALGSLHGYGIAQRLQQLSRDVVQVQQGAMDAEEANWRRLAEAIGLILATSEGGPT